MEASLRLAIPLMSSKRRTRRCARARPTSQRHLYELFPPAFVHPHPDAWIEIAYGDPATGGKPDEAKHFSAFDLAGAAEFAEKKNRAGFNIYVGACTAAGQDRRRAKGRANGANVLTASLCMGRVRRAGDDERIDGILKEKNLATAMIVMTGTHADTNGHISISSLPAALLRPNCGPPTRR